MKVKICNETTKDRDYDIVSPLLGKNIHELEYADSECDEIICTLVEKNSITNLHTVLQNYVRKLRHGGKIVFQGVDFVQVCLAVVNRNITIFDANKLLYGGPEAFNMNSCMVCANDIAAILGQLGLNVTKKAMYNGQYTVEAYRP